MKRLPVLLAVAALPNFSFSQEKAIFVDPVFPVVEQAGGMEVSDVDGDGLVDVILAAYEERVAVLRGLPYGSFAETEFYGNQVDFTDVVVIDLDLDGDKDVVAINGTSTSTVLATLIGNGTGSFGLRPLVSLARGTRPSPQRVEAGDLDGDGFPDIAVVTEEIPVAGSPVGPNTVLWLKGDGAGNLLLPPIRLAAPAIGEPQDLLVADFNGDDIDDIAVTDDANQLSLYHGGPGGPVLVSGQGLPTGSEPAGMAVGHLDDDNRLDLVVINGGADSLSIYFGAPIGFGQPMSLLSDPSPSSSALVESNGGADFTLGASFGLRYPVVLPSGPAPRSAAIGDADGDGDADLVVGGAMGIEVFLGDGIGSLSAPVESYTGSAVSHVHLVDLDGRDGEDVLFLDDRGPGYRMASGGGRYGRMSTVTNEPRRRRVSTADMNLDGHFDIVSTKWINYAASAEPSDVAVQLGDGKGRFSAPIVQTLIRPPDEHAIGDLNGDGIPDLAAGTDFAFFPVGSYPFWVLEGDGSGGFSSVVRYGVQTLSVGGAQMADFNGDGALDVVFGMNNIGVSVMLNDGFGGLLASQVVWNSVPHEIQVEDFDLDGSMDFVTLDWSRPDIHVGRNDGTGLGFSITSHFSGQEARGLVVGDFNNDGAPDIVNCGDGSNFQGVSGPSIFVNDGAGGFDLWGSFLPYGLGMGGNAVYDLETIDFDRDGNLDLAFACRHPRGVGVVMGDGAGGFSTPVYHHILEEFFSNSRATIALADFDSDGRPDLVHEDGWDNPEMHLLFNQLGAPVGELPSRRLTGPSLRSR